jgi:molecular chaperone GrpE
MTKDSSDQTPEPDPEAAGSSPAAGADAGEERDAAEAVDPALRALIAERDRLQDQLARTMADLHNIRKRHGKELEEARQRAMEGLASELLPVLDNFELALAAHEQHESAASNAAETASMVEGVRMVRRLLRGTLERHGLTEIPALDRPFDPNVHEAVGIDSQADVAPGHVSLVMQQGYSMGDRLLRAAKVMVAAAPEGAKRSSADDRQGSQQTSSKQAGGEASSDDEIQND